jgi:hypothetical protein
MAVLVEALSVVVRRTVIEGRYPGGLKAYRAVFPRTFCMDDHLTRVGFLQQRDVQLFCERELSKARLASSTGHRLAFDVVSGSVAIVEQRQGPWGDPHDSPWLEYREDGQGVCACWLAGTEPGPLAAPDGWSPESSRGMVRLPADLVAGARPLTGREREPRPGYVRLYTARAYPDDEDEFEPQPESEK